MADLTVHRYDYAMPDELVDFDVASYVEGALEWIDGVDGPEDRVALSASGGVDSTTVGFLLKEVLGDRLHAFFIDDGLRRLIGGREEWQVTAEIFGDFPNFEVIHTDELVIPWFEGVEDGTLKREMFRSLYTLTSNKHIASLQADWIADGTIFPDIVMTDQNRQIQHNVNLPYSMNKLEPFSALYKPHVRRVAARLGMPREFAMKIPCPGPAQLLRVGGPFSADKLRVSKVATDVVETMVCEHLEERWGEPFRYDEATGVRTPFQYFAPCLDPEMEERPGARDYKRLLEVLKLSLDRMSKLSDNLLLLSEGGLDRSSWSVVDMSAVVDEVVQEAHAQAAAAHISLELERPSEGMLIAGDPLSMKQAVLNLVDNAIKYNRRGGWVKVSARSEGHLVIVEVQDSGGGISETDQQHIFDRFYRVDKSRSRAQGGSGLGLAIVRKIVEDHGGLVSVHSTLGEGSSFRIALPHHTPV